MHMGNVLPHNPLPVSNFNFGHTWEEKEKKKQRNQEKAKQIFLKGWTDGKRCYRDYFHCPWLHPRAGTCLNSKKNTFARWETFFGFLPVSTHLRRDPIFSLSLARGHSTGSGYWSIRQGGGEEFEGLVSFGHISRTRARHETNGP